VIFAKNLSLSYDGKKDIIKNASFKISKKDFVFITGTSGSGKSTLLKSFYGDIGIKDGKLKVDKFIMNNISKSNLRKLRQSIGIVFQDYKLIEEYTVEENIMLSLKINGYNEKICKSQAQKLLRHIKMSSKASFYPQFLSGGEQQRVAVARALAHNPPIIIADEPTGNLDDFSAEVIWNLFKGANEQLGITVVTATHRIPIGLGVKYKKFTISDGLVYEVN